MPKTLEQIASELGISRTTLWRRLSELGYEAPKGCIYPEVEAEIERLVRGYSKLKKKENHRKEDRPASKNPPKEEDETS